MDQFVVVTVQSRAINELGGDIGPTRLTSIDLFFVNNEGMINEITSTIGEGDAFDLGDGHC